MEIGLIVVMAMLSLGIIGLIWFILRRKWFPGKSPNTPQTMPPPAAAPAAAGTGASATNPLTPRGGTERWYSEYGLSIVVVVVGAALVYWGFQNTQIRPTDAGRLGWTYWLPLLIIWGVLAALVALNSKTLGAAAGVLQWVFAGVMVALLVILPLWHWVESPSVGASQVARSEIPLASSPQSSWPKLVIPAGGRSERIPVPQSMHVVMGGENFRFHCVYRDGHEESFGKGGSSCSDGNMPYVYATNENSKDVNIVSYAYATK